MSTPIIRNVRDAKLPAVYVEAQKALAACQRIDECKEWADRATAIASYARQAQDSTLMDTATRIKARAIRRCGELLKEIERSDKGGRPKKNGAGTDPVSRKGAARDAGLSERQRKDALRVASIPEQDFEDAVESDDPPTITELSEAGKREAANLAKLRAPKPPGFRDATSLLGSLGRFAEFCDHADVALVADALSEREAQRIRRDLAPTMDWLRRMDRRLAVDEAKRGAADQVDPDDQWFEIFAPWDERAQEALTDGVQVLTSDEQRVIVIALEHLAAQIREGGSTTHAPGMAERLAQKFRAVIFERPFDPNGTQVALFDGEGWRTWDEAEQ